VVTITVPRDARAPGRLLEEIRRPQQQIGSEQVLEPVEDRRWRHKVEHEPVLKIASLPRISWIGTGMRQHVGVEKTTVPRHLQERPRAERTGVPSMSEQDALGLGQPVTHGTSPGPFDIFS
jgi:hypothetical protein